MKIIEPYLLDSIFEIEIKLGTNVCNFSLKTPNYSNMSMSEVLKVNVNRIYTLWDYLYDCT